ncbi:MAG: YbhB/YbcL family Raf kinase inhibitor-like protein [Candidatus Omnitrophica bacterium]|nr:YbhB/YbcL family Raf kinase inhibitor-like protein [Candidatus Omnitrophota bacterium]
MKLKRLLILAAVFLLGCSFLVNAKEDASMKLTSPDFKNNEYVPKRMSCDGPGLSPALLIEGVPSEAKSLALIVDDPDAPAGTFIHWVLFNISVTGKIEEGTIPGKQGINTAGELNYVSPCPPSGTHRYFFKIYALDDTLDLNEGITKADLELAMQGHILAQAQLIGLCKRK